MPGRCSELIAELRRFLLRVSMVVLLGRDHQTREGWATTRCSDRSARHVVSVSARDDRGGAYISTLCSNTPLRRRGREPRDHDEHIRLFQVHLTCSLMCYAGPSGKPTTKCRSLSTSARGRTLAPAVDDGLPHGRPLHRRQCPECRRDASLPARVRRAMVISTDLGDFGFHSTILESQANGGGSSGNPCSITSAPVR